MAVTWPAWANDVINLVGPVKVYYVQGAGKRNGLEDLSLYTHRFGLVTDSLGHRVELERLLLPAHGDGRPCIVHIYVYGDVPRSLLSEQAKKLRAGSLFSGKAIFYVHLFQRPMTGITTSNR